MFSGSFNGVFRSFNGVSKKLHVCFMKVTRKIEGGCIEGVLRVSQGSLKSV